MPAGFVVIALVALVVAGGSWWFQYRLRQKRIANLLLVAQRLGFEFSPDDVNNTMGYPFDLFTRGDGQGIENVMWGERNGVPMCAFDFWYYEESTDNKGRRSRSYSRFTCAAMTIAADCPTLRIGHEGVFTRIGSALGFKDVELEYDEFNREYRVHCADQKFAFSLLDGRMMEFLLRVSSIDALEIVGPFVLIATGKLASQDWPVLVETAEQFHEHVPNVVWTTWARTKS
jgi:hypothetical protein